MCFTTFDSCFFLKSNTNNDQIVTTTTPNTANRIIEEYWE